MVISKMILNLYYFNNNIVKESGVISAHVMATLYCTQPVLFLAADTFESEGEDATAALTLKLEKMKETGHHLKNHSPSRGKAD